jgi:hypothetical protein
LNLFVFLYLANNIAFLYVMFGQRSIYPEDCLYIVLSSWDCWDSARTFPRHCLSKQISTSKAMDCPEYSSLPDFRCSPWIIGLNNTETKTLINPFNGRFFEASLPIFKGKTCLGCFRDWLLMLDEGTRECFLGNVTSYSKISLPPLLDPIDSLGKFALSSQTHCHACLHVRRKVCLVLSPWR